MANPILIGVGGTGQTVVASYIRLAELAGFTPASFYVVDSDRLGPLSSALTKLKSRVQHTIGGGEIADKFMIDPYPTANAERKTFGALFGNLTGERRELFNCLFTPDAEMTQIRTGMYGRPSIGATSIRYKILKNDRDLQELKNTLRGGEKHIILVGSCFGGTGSGGVPMLAHEFHKLNRDEDGYSLKVDAVTFLPWFRLVQPAGDMKQSDLNLHERLNDNFEPNAAAGINYFKDKIRDYVDTLLLLGVRDPGMVQRISNESSQEETVHILNLLAAILIQNHFCGQLNPPRGIAGYWYEDQDGISSKSLMIQRNGNGNSISLLNAIKRTALRRQWIAKLNTFFLHYKEISKFYKPPFLEISIRRLEGTLKKEHQVLKEFSEQLSKYAEEAQEIFNWVEQLDDKFFFRLKSEDKKVGSEEYERMLNDPFPIIRDWCKKDDLCSQFEDHDFESTEHFCQKFTTLFLDHLIKKFQL